MLVNYVSVFRKRRNERCFVSPPETSHVTMLLCDRQGGGQFRLSPYDIGNDDIPLSRGHGGFDLKLTPYNVCVRYHIAGEYLIGVKTRSRFHDVI